MSLLGFPLPCGFITLVMLVWCHHLEQRQPRASLNKVMTLFLAIIARWILRKWEEVEQANEGAGAERSPCSKQTSPGSIWNQLTKNKTQQPLIWAWLVLATEYFVGRMGSLWALGVILLQVMSMGTHKTTGAWGPPKSIPNQLILGQPTPSSAWRFLPAAN